VRSSRFETRPFYSWLTLISSPSITSHTSYRYVVVTTPHLTVTTAQRLCRICALSVPAKNIQIGVNHLPCHMMITLQPTIKPFALSDMKTKIDTDGSTNVIQKNPNKVNPQKSSKRQTHSTSQPNSPWYKKRRLIAHLTTAPRSIGIRLRRGIAIPTHRSHIARRRLRADLLIRLIRTRETIVSALRDTVPGAEKHEYAKKHKPDADGRCDDDRDFLLHKRAFHVFRRRRRRAGRVGDGGVVCWCMGSGCSSGLVESGAEEVGVRGGGVGRG
jgi:hypothetical protein